MKEYIKLFNTTTEYNTSKDNLDLPNVAYCVDLNDVHYNPWVDRSFTITFSISDSMPVEIVPSKISGILDYVEIDGIVPSEDTDLRNYIFDTTGNHTVKYVLNTYRIPDRSFSDNKITAVSISEGITQIEEAAFLYCSSLASITLHNKIEFIETNAFADTLWETNQSSGVLYNSSIALGYKGTVQNGEISIAEGTLTIANSFGYGVNNLTSIVIPSTVKNIGFFLGTYNTNSITFKSEVPPKIVKLSGASFMINATNIYVPAASVEIYKTTPDWSDYASKIQAIPTI